MQNHFKKLLLLFQVTFMSMAQLSPHITKPHHLIVHVLSSNTSLLALVEPEIRIRYYVSVLEYISGNFDEYSLDHCISILEIRCQTCQKGEVFTGACSTEVAELDVSVSAGFYFVTAALHVHDKSLAASTTRVEVLSQKVALVANKYRTQTVDINDGCHRSNVINTIIAQQGYSSYLEIGTMLGSNFERIQARLKESVDPIKRYGAHRTRKAAAIAMCLMIIPSQLILSETKPFLETKACFEIIGHENTTIEKYGRKIGREERAWTSDEWG